jgi:hypothetical protein
MAALAGTSRLTGSAPDSALGAGLESGPEGAARPGAGVRLARGARAAEALLLAALARDARAVARDPTRLARPFRVVVPSESLRLHVSARLVASAARSLAGVRVQTLPSLAREVLARAGEPAEPAQTLFPVLVRQASRREPVLRTALEAFHDGYGAVVGGVADLLDAGFEPCHAEALDDCLCALAPGPDRERARALARVAGAVHEALARWGQRRPTDLLRRARERLEREPERALPARGLWIHGFADATGVVTDLLCTLLRCRGATLVLDQPPDPADPTRPDPGVRFTRRFAERLVAVAAFTGEAAEPSVLEPSSQEPAIELAEAPGACAEVRGVAEDVRALLDAGLAPERISVVARDLRPYRAALRTHFERLGIPFSGVREAGPEAPAARRVRALEALLESGERTPCERWLDAACGLQVPGDVRRREELELRLALHALGAGRLDDVARLEPDALVEEGGYPLPVRTLSAREDDAGGSVPVAPRRRLPRERLEAAVRAARGLVARLERWPDEASFAVHREHLLALLQGALHWQAEGAEEAAFAALAALASEVPAGFPLGRGDFALLVRRALEAVGATPLGGAGGGVQVLSVTEARARTHAHLFLLGLGRDVFPRPIREDPLLPDALRRALARAVLPDLPVKERGHDEERFLFAQLLSSAPDVHVSWQITADDGKPRARSVLADELLSARPGHPVRRRPALLAPEPGPARERPAYEALLLAGLRGGHAAHAALLPAALAESAGRVEAEPELGALALARARVLAELDPGFALAREPGPYFGFVGEARAQADPRRRDPFVTTLERVALCPWQAFVQRVLRVAPPPDALDSLPALEARHVGSLVHRVLERVVRSALGPGPATLAEALRRSPVPVPWPDAASLDALLDEEARALAREEGIALHGFAPALVARARPRLDLARALDWSGEPPAVLGAELVGECTLEDVSGRTRRIGFRADRVDACGGRLRLTDYKTGRAFSEAAGADTRRKHWVRDARAGRWLQAIAYAFAAADRPSEGRLLFCDPEQDVAHAQARVDASDAELGAAFRNAARRVLDAWDRGAFFPRLAGAGDDAEPPACERCEVSEACLRGDSGARRRLLEWIEAEGADGSQAEHAARALWHGAQEEES